MMIQSITYRPWSKYSPVNYSSDCKGQLKKAITELFKARLPRFELNENTSIKVKGHFITVKSNLMTQKLNLIHGTKEIVFKKNGFIKEPPVDGPEAELFRKAIKDLQKEARILGLSEQRTYDSPRPVAKSESAKKTLVDRVTSPPVSDTLAVLRNLLSLIKICSFSSVIAYLFSGSQPIILSIIAGLRIFQGVLSIIQGVKKLREAQELYRLAEQNHDVEGMKIYKNQKKNAKIVIGEGVLWMALGIVFLACPHVGVIFSIMQSGLFYGGFGWDALLTWKIANQLIDNVHKQYELFKAAVLNNDLSLEQKQKASVEFLRLILEVTQEEKDKIRQNWLADETMIERRIAEKRLKKRLIASRMGITPELYLDVINGKADAYKKIQECFEKSIAEQRASKFLAGFCLVASAMGLPLDLPEWFESLKFIAMGINPDHLGAGTDALWVAVNFGYLAEDGSCFGQPITHLFQKRVSELPPRANQAMPMAAAV